MKDPLSNLGQNIRTFRMKKGLSQEALAQVLKVDKAYVSRVEGGKKNLTMKSLAKIAGALSIDIKKLFL
ncbi:hypothetical protein A3F55_00095 [Candidatus Adlerbacteria bacterium RIFCSPHIGHO2_12_FULL_53_18]|uniref:HTH cro/C1-type domain-containing protein n=1 Tax=Candidatus Adlerbacteria bacterium RIFCSPHIGHO2_12_FULL_53_18 TaxID=1797242 RepID=A0A1F4XT16_9BACT|nr:MAG: hypothetical protein A3F55_00095 [Candidatus Adlerbacteria bacterium RIFCSPHIGHO2_12_FULL_53_18]